MTLSLTSHWPELNHMSTPINKGAGKSSLYSKWPFPQLKIGNSIREKEWLLGAYRNLGAANNWKTFHIIMSRKHSNAFTRDVLK